MYGHEAFRGSCRRFTPLRRSSAGARHHTGVSVGHDGAALAQAQRLKRRTYLELSGDHGRVRLVVLAAEVGGWWSEENSGLRQAVNEGEIQVRASDPGGACQAGVAAPVVLDACVRQRARAFALSLLDRRPVSG